jgi:hypothetical protein
MLRCGFPDKDAEASCSIPTELRDFAGDGAGREPDGLVKLLAGRRVYQTALASL